MRSGSCTAMGHTRSEAHAQVMSVGSCSAGNRMPGADRSRLSTSWKKAATTSCSCDTWCSCTPGKKRSVGGMLSVWHYVFVQHDVLKAGSTDMQGKYAHVRIVVDGLQLKRW